MPVTTVSASSRGAGQVKAAKMKTAPQPISLRDAFVFVVPAVLAVNMEVGGRLFLSELLLLAALPWLIAEKRFTRPSAWPTRLVVVGVLWLWAQIVTDLYRSSPLSDSARGWLNIAFTLFDFAVILMLIDGQRRRIVLFAAGIAVGFTFEYQFNPNVYASENPWKFGVAIPVTLLIALAACSTLAFRTRFAQSTMLLGAGLVNLLLGFRSLGGVCLCAAAYLATQAATRSDSRPRRTSILRVVAFCLIGAALGAFTITAYGHAARDGLFGQIAAKKYRQESTGRFGVLLGGRPEAIASARAISDSPFIGHGSRPRNPRYENYMLSWLSRQGYRPSGDLLYTIHHSNYLIPTHSYLLGSWVQAGLFGGAFWLVALALLASTLLAVHKVSDPLSPLLAFLGTLLVWDILFSPYGAEHRLVSMYSLVVLIEARRLRTPAARSEPSYALADVSQLAGGGGRRAI